MVTFFCKGGTTNLTNVATHVVDVDESHSDSTQTDSKITISSSIVLLQQYPYINNKDRFSNGERILQRRNHQPYKCGFHVVDVDKSHSSSTAIMEDPKITILPCLLQLPMP
ncbi:hypothetical protein TNIN_319621 [Trichonephila inaurata madagascariensis]|uniref:Uncharacterized protein n=1 Tax=Trichonephila inaurata madagascariensis TaxID=2747483 RepID=A0A8X6WLL6_9ARAC|nr:hypothetical protein TNIN_319621 [Trichonephila inaurata madagascariensis]